MILKIYFKNNDSYDAVVKKYKFVIINNIKYCPGCGTEVRTERKKFYLKCSYYLRDISMKIILINEIA